jgi:hypothetical protein
MESIPEQRIQALPGATRKEAYWKIEALCFLRAHTNLSEDEIAEKAQFGSAKAMYQQLMTWELTGLLPPEKQEETPKPKVEKPGRKPRSSGPPEEVADPSAAAHLFDEAIEGLARIVEDLEHLDLVYQGKRFAGTYGFTGNWVFLRRSYSEQGWEEECERYGQDPNVESFHVDNLSSQHPLGASPYPPRDLVALIAAYALSDRPLELLLEALQPGHTEEDIEEVKILLNQTKRQGDKKDGLRRAAQQFAAAVYGRKVGRGSPVEELPRGHLLACYITARREVGIADEEIHRNIRSKGHELDKKEFNRLANLGLKFPRT